MKIELSLEAVNLVLTALAELPLKQSFLTWNDIKTQGEAQLRQKEEVPVEEVPEKTNVEHVDGPA